MTKIGTIRFRERCHYAVCQHTHTIVGGFEMLPVAHVLENLGTSWWRSLDVGRTLEDGVSREK